MDGRLWRARLRTLGSCLMLLVTSIAPKATVDYQATCIRSWQDSGFQVATVNPRSEIESVAQFGVECVTIEREGRPQIVDILQVVRDRHVSHAGIINSDCVMLSYPGLVDALIPHLDRELIVSERIDVDENWRPLPGRPLGFDAFFFATDVLGDFLSSDLAIGDTFWDYWFPTALADMGRRVTLFDRPFLLHRAHAKAWDEHSWYANGRVYWSVLRPMIENNPNSFAGLVELTGPLPDVLTDEKVILLADRSYTWFTERRWTAPELELTPTSGDLLSRLLDGFHAIRSATVDLRPECHRLNLIVASQAKEVDRLQRELHDLNARTEAEREGLRAQLSELATTKNAELGNLRSRLLEIREQQTRRMQSIAPLSETVRRAGVELPAEPDRETATATVIQANQILNSWSKARGQLARLLRTKSGR